MSTPVVTRRTAKGEATRGRLLDVAAGQLVATGVLEVAAVARGAGVAQSVLYRYFDGRSGLVSAVVERFYDEYDLCVFGVTDVPGDTWAAREALRLRREVAFFYEHPLGRPVASGMLREPAATQVDATRTRAQVLVAARNIRAGQRAGELPEGVDGDLAAAGIIGAVRAMLAEALSRTPPPDVNSVANMAFRAGATLLHPADAPDVEGAPTR